jgi:hypothetical protein
LRKIKSQIRLDNIKDVLSDEHSIKLLPVLRLVLRLVYNLSEIIQIQQIDYIVLKIYFNLILVQPLSNAIFY